MGLCFRTSPGQLKLSVPNQPAVHSVERTGVRSLKSFGDESLPPCYITQRDSPVMNIAQVILPIYDIALNCRRPELSIARGVSFVSAMRTDRLFPDGVASSLRLGQFPSASQR